MNYLEELATSIRRQVPDTLIPPDSEYLFVLYAVLVRVKGAGATLSDVHDVWTAWMTAMKQTHTAMVPFDSLDLDTQASDAPYLLAVHHVAIRTTEEAPE